MRTRIRIGLFTEVTFKPGEAALSCNSSYSWEARTVGWLEAEMSLPSGRESVAE